MAGLNWLHVSDWHEGREELKLNREVILEKFFEDISKRTDISPCLEKIDYLFFTGDIAFSGQAHEFQKAKSRLIDPALGMLGADTRVFFVPGNHDLDRKKIDEDFFPKTYNEIISDPNFELNRNKLEELISSEERVAVVNSTLSAYNDFVSGYCSGYDKSELFHVEKLQRGDHTIALVGLNSAWTCARSSLTSHSSGEKADFWDYGGLKLTETQIRNAIAKARPFDIGIVMLHHPLNWLTEYEQALAEQLIVENFDLVLHGHEHRPRINKSSSAYGDTVTIPAGALYTRRLPPDPRYRNSYNFGSLDVNSLVGRVFYRSWSEETDRWAEDTRFWKEGQAPFLLSGVSGEREKSAREELFELQRQFEPFIKKRAADKASIKIKHTPVTIAGRQLLEVEIEHSIEIEPGVPERFPVSTKGNARVAKLLPAEQSHRLYELIELLPNYSESQSSDVLRDRAEVHMGPERTHITYKYRMLETNEGVWKFTIGRFMRNVKMYMKLSPEHDYEFSALGGFPALHPVHNDFFEVIEMETDGLALPRQGYLVQWYPKEQSMHTVQQE